MNSDCCPLSVNLALFFFMVLTEIELREKTIKLEKLSQQKTYLEEDLYDKVTVENANHSRLVYANKHNSNLVCFAFVCLCSSYSL